MPVPVPVRDIEEPLVDSRGLATAPVFVPGKARLLLAQKEAAPCQTRLVKASPWAARSREPAPPVGFVIGSVAAVQTPRPAFSWRYQQPPATPPVSFVPPLGVAPFCAWEERRVPFPRAYSLVVGLPTAARACVRCCCAYEGGGLVGRVHDGCALPRREGGPVLKIQY